MIRLSAFADEASASLSEQIEALRASDIPYIELRGINGKNVSAISEEEAHIYKRQLDEGGIEVFSIGSPIGKIKLGEGMEEHFALLRHICRLANIFGTKRIRVFSFYEAYGRDEEVFSALRTMVGIAEEYGVCLYHENEKGIWGDTAERVLKIKKNVEGLRFVYDPANFIECGEAPDVTLPLLFESISYFHIKDALLDERCVVPAGYGDGRIAELIDRIGDRDMTLSLEPHLMVFQGYAELDSTKMQDRFVYSTGAEAFRAAADALKGLLIAAGYKKTEGGYIL